MQQHTATDTFNDQQLFFQILVLERQLFCWVGTAQARMSTLTLAMPTPLDPVPSATSLLRGPGSDDEIMSMSQRLAKKTGRAVALSVNLPSGEPLMRAWAEKRLLQELQALQLVQQTANLSLRKFAVPVSQKEVERDWAAQGFHCGCMIDPPGHEWNNFTHTANELVTVVEGRMRLTFFDTDHYILEPGDEIFIPAGVPHSTKNIAAVNSKWFYGYDGAANSWF